VLKLGGVEGVRLFWFQMALEGFSGDIGNNLLKITGKLVPQPMVNIELAWTGLNEVVVENKGGRLD